MRALPIFLLAAAGLLMPAAAVAQDAAAAILGTWRGTSLCTNRDVAPACKDENVVYVFEHRDGTPPGSLLLHASKIVDGATLPMGDLEMTLDPATATWSSEIRNERVHAIWSFTVEGEVLKGTLIDVPTKAQVRKAEARR